MPETKKTTVTPQQIAHFLEQTGFIFEMRMKEAFVGRGYQCEIGSSFYDLEGETEREIDLLASKDFPNGIRIHFVIECKQSLLDKWIFISTKNAGRYYYAVKHLPRVDIKTLEEKKLFTHFHTFDRNVRLTHNYICYSVATNKKADQLQINECVYKLPKATADLASKLKEEKAIQRHILFPVGLFSGQLFTLRYEGSAVVDEVPFLQFFTSFQDGAYDVDFSRLVQEFPGVNPSTKSREMKLKMAARSLVKLYQIDFVTESGLEEYLTQVEKQVEAVKIDNWPLPQPKPEEPGAAKA